MSTRSICTIAVVAMTVSAPAHAGLFRLAAHLAKDGIEAEHLTAKGAKAAAVVEAGSAAVGEEAQAVVKTAERKGTSEASALVEDVKKTGEGVKKVGEVLKEGGSEGETGVGEKTPWWAYALGIVLLPLGAVFVIGQYVIRPVMIVWRIGGAVWRFFRRKAPADADSGLVSPEVGAQS